MRVRNTNELPTTAALVVLAVGLAAHADPPPQGDGVCGGALFDPVFCFTVTDLATVAPSSGSYLIEFEIVNWTSTDAAGLVLSLNTGDGAGPGSPIFGGAFVDADGRPVNGPPSPPIGNTALGNSWAVLDSTGTRVEFGGGNLLPPPSIEIDGTTYVGLLDPAIALLPSSLCEFVTAAMIPGSTHFPGVILQDPLSIDDGPNALDGFVVRIDDWNIDEQVSFNWHMIDAAGDAIGVVGPDLGQIGNAYGFGTFNIVRLDLPSGSSAPGALFAGNRGYDPLCSVICDNNPKFWSEDGGVFPVNPIRPGEPEAGQAFAIEFGAAVTAPFSNAADNAFTVGGAPVVSGVNFVLGDPLAPEGACCVNGTCTDARAESECTALGGSYQGDGTDCATTICLDSSGACCLGDVCTADSDEIGCAMLGGMFRGIGADCAAMTCGVRPCDFDLNGAVNINDLLAYLGPFFADGSGGPSHLPRLLVRSGRRRALPVTRHPRR